MSLAAIHILKKELGLSDTEYRTILRDTAGVASAAQLDEIGDRAVMSRLYSLRDASRQTAVRPAKTPTEAKIWALWYELKGYLPKQEQTLAYLLGFVRRAAGNQDVKEAGDLAGLTGKESYNVIEALKRRLEQERATVAQEVPF
ncbi:phage protein GemA/Gp16 family protein [uncultured Victivallis sp.]|uniref:phage protein GemA/Gp16 family protein n=1 Tax=uncultured Victivallis sp. TaxID=354118 RepID=UPI000E98EFB3|nr:phage protein GemA/Gp16 family protein [uncultured Victivallis sp.]HBP08037.1 hypothetical protein [Lentisphaeria bacterium]